MRETLPARQREARSEVDAQRKVHPPAGSVRRLGSVIGLTTITLLDLLALDDITTAGAWMPEIAFVIASIPALITLAYFAFRRSDFDRQPRIGRGSSGQ